MKKLFFTAAASLLLSFAFAATTVNAQAGDGWLSRYWDGCKPSCSWSGKQYNGQGQCKECNQSNQKITTSDQNKSSCENGTSYTCWDMAPWAVDANTAYGFAAAHRDQQCGTCWELTFNGGFQHGGAGATHQALKGKKLTVMISNIGGDVNGNQLDFLVPGGGVGQFDSFSKQIGVTNNALGSQYGGLLDALGNPTALPGAQNQLKEKCTSVFGGSGKEWLKAGCDFYADWMMAANNPTYNAKSVTCPAALVDRWKNAASGSPPSTGGNPPPAATYNLTVNRNNNNGGTVTPTSQSNISSGTAINISATASSGWTFVNWTVTSGTATFANANNATTTVTLSSTATIVANFQQQQTTTYTLTVARNNNSGGTVTPTSQAGIASGASVNISATAASGYTFQNWVVSSGTATIANANSASTSVTISSNATVTANFQQQQTTAPTYTLTVNRNPTAGGATTPASSQTGIAAGTAVSITATPATGYRFVNWTGGTGTFGNANSATTTVTVNATMTITANFAQEQQTPTTYTLTVNPSPAVGGSVTPASQQTGIASGARVAITATAAAGYSFQGWVVSSGTANIENTNQASTGVYLSSNATISANFREQAAAVTYTLTVSRSPQNGGSTTPPTSQQNIAAGTDVPITATAASGYEFVNWTGPSGTVFGDASSQNTTVKVNSAITITANFRVQETQTPGGGGGCTIPADRTYIIKMEAENYTSQSGSGMQTTTANGITNIGYIENGYSATYNNVSAAGEGSYSMRFRLATEMNPSNFKVKVNGQEVGSISLPNTGSWNTYQMVTLCANNGGVSVPLNKGNNTVVLEFGNAVNVDYFEFLGAPPAGDVGGGDPPAATYTLTVNRESGWGGTTSPAATQSGIAAGAQFTISAFPNNGYAFVNWEVTSGAATATIADPGSATTTVTLTEDATVTAIFEQTSGVKLYGTAKAAGRTRVSLIPAARGFSAALPANHGYTGYTLVDLRGREIRSGKIGPGVTDLRFSGLNRSVMFLKLSGKGGSPLVLKAVTY